MEVLHLFRHFAASSCCFSQVCRSLLASLLFLIQQAVITAGAMLYICGTSLLVIMPA